MITSELEYVAVRTTDKHQVLPEISKTATETFQTMQQVYGDDALIHWRMMGLLVGQKRTGRTERKGQDVAMLVRANLS